MDEGLSVRCHRGGAARLAQAAPAAWRAFVDGMLMIPPADRRAADAARAERDALLAWRRGQGVEPRAAFGR